MEPRADYPSLPPRPVDVMRQVSAVATIRRKLRPSTHKMFQEFREIVQLGSQAPTFRLQTTSGEWINTADYLGKKHLVLEFGAIT